MSALSTISNYIRGLFVNLPFGVTYPPRTQSRSAVDDGRTAALRVLKRYISELTFTRANNTEGLPPIAFRIREDAIHIEAADHEKEEEFPSVAFVQTEDGKYEPIGLTALGLEQALIPTEQAYGVRFRMPTYYNQVATFSLASRRLDEGADAARHRRQARISVELTYNVVVLVNVAELRPIVQINVDVDESTGEEVILHIGDDNTEVMPP